MDDKTKQAFIDAGQFITEQEYLTILSGVLSCVASNAPLSSVDQVVVQMCEISIALRSDVNECNKTILRNRDAARQGESI